MTRFSNRRWAGWVVLAAVAACTRGQEPPASPGPGADEPLAILLQAKGRQPRFDLVVRFNPPVPSARAVESVADAVAEARAQCVDAIPEDVSPEVTTHLDMKVDHGRVEGGKSADGLASCLLRALDGRTLLPADTVSREAAMDLKVAPRPRIPGD